MNLFSRLILLVAVLPFLFLLSIVIWLYSYLSNGLIVQLLVTLLLLISTTWLTITNPPHVRRKKKVSVSSPPIAGKTSQDLVWRSVFEQSPEPDRRKYEIVMSALLQGQGFEVFKSSDFADQGLDLVAMKGNEVLVVEVKDRVVTTPDLNAFLAGIRESNLEEQMRNRTVTPVIVAKDYTESVRHMAEEQNVHLWNLSDLKQFVQGDRDKQPKFESRASLSP